MTLPRISEKVEQQHGITLLRSIGADVWVLGTRRAKTDFQGTRQTPGLPDVFAVLPKLPRYTYDQPVRAEVVGDPARRALWWECKAIGGRLRPEQQHFQTCCQQADLWHVVGPFDALLEALAERGYVNRGSLAHYRKAAR